MASKARIVKEVETAMIDKMALRDSLEEAEQLIANAQSEIRFGGVAGEHTALIDLKYASQKVAAVRISLGIAATQEHSR
jgi:hypothetical protein